MLEIAPLLGILARQLYWVYLTYIVGEGVTALKNNSEAAKTDALSKVECYKIYREALDKGQTPPSCVGNPNDTDWTTIALIGGSVILAVLLLGKKR